MEREQTRRLMHRGTLALLYALAAMDVLEAFLFHPGINWYARARFVDMVSGTAYRPYVFRALVPDIIRTVSSVTPAPLKHAAVALIEGTRSVQTLGWEHEFLFEYLFGVAIFFGCFIGLAVVLRLLLKSLYRFPPWVADLMPLVGLIALPAFFRFYNHLYDPATLLLFSLGLWFLVSGKRVWFYLIFALAVFQKETSILLVALYVIWSRGTMSKRGLTLSTLALVSFWFLGRMLVWQRFASNPGSFVEFHLEDHFLALWTNLPALLYLAGMGVVWGFLVGYRWKEKPPLLRTGLIVMLAPLIALAAFFGTVDEMRQYFEVYPAAFLLTVPTIAGCLGISEEKALNYGGGSSSGKN
jgi:hypothetical protein